MCVERIARQLPGRTADMIKNRFYCALRYVLGNKRKRIVFKIQKEHKESSDINKDIYTCCCDKKEFENFVIYNEVISSYINNNEDTLTEKKGVESGNEERWSEEVMTIRKNKYRNEMSRMNYDWFINKVVCNINNKEQCNIGVNKEIVEQRLKCYEEVKRLITKEMNKYINDY